MKRLACLSWVLLLVVACESNNPSAVTPSDLSPATFAEIEGPWDIERLREPGDPGAPLARAAVGDTPPSLDVYDNQAAFDQVCPGLPIEGFEGHRPVDAQECPSPLSSASDDACFAPGAVLEGFELSASTGRSYVTLNAFFFGNPSSVVGPWHFVDDTELSFSNATGVRFLLSSTTGESFQVEVFEADGSSLGTFASTSADLDSPGHFIGIRAEEPIGRILISREGLVGEVIDDLAFGLCFLPVEIDIKPGSSPNSVNLVSQRSLVPVAILSTPEFDATQVDHTTLVFAGASETHVDRRSGDPRRHEEDVDQDGDLDLVMHVRLGETQLEASSTEGTLVGRTFDGTPIQGSDAVRVVGRR